MRGVHQGAVERQSALPELDAAFGTDELIVESETREHRAQAQHHQRDQHDPGAFMRMIARRAGLLVAVTMIVMAMAVMPGFFLRRFMVPVNRMLDMFRSGPAGLAEEGQEHQAPRIEAGEQGREHADQIGTDPRSEKRRGGKEWVST